MSESLPNTPACVCSARHSPTPMQSDAHHEFPEYLGGPPHQATMLGLCQTTHANVHRILREMVAAGQWLPRAPGVPRYSHQVATLGFQAWDAAGRPKPYGAGTHHA